MEIAIEEMSGITGALGPAAPQVGIVPDDVAELLPDAPGTPLRLPAAAADPWTADWLVDQALGSAAADPAPELESLPFQPQASHRPQGASLPSDAAPALRLPVLPVARQLAQAVVTARDDQLEIALAPEELGRIRMTIAGPDHSPQVLIWAERPDVLDQLRRNAACLQESFAEAGLTASFEFREDGSAESRDGASFPERPGAGEDGLDIADAATAPLLWTPMAIPARLDIRI